MDVVTITRKKGPYSITMEGAQERFMEMVKAVDSLAARLDAGNAEPESVEPIIGEQEPPVIAGATSAPDAVDKLFSSGWGRKPRPIREIKEVLEASAVFYPITTLSGVLIALAKQGKLRRWKTPQGYVYVRGGATQ